MLHKIDHVGIAVTDIEEAIKTYQGLEFKLTGRESVSIRRKWKLHFSRLASHVSN